MTDSRCKPQVQLRRLCGHRSESHRRGEISTIARTGPIKGKLSLTRGHWSDTQSLAEFLNPYRKEPDR